MSLRKKNRKNKSILSEILILLTVALVITGYFLFKKELKINKLDINAVILNNGDVNVTESFLYKFKGKYNGVFREYNLIDCDDYIINSISTVDSSGEETIAEFNESGMPNTFDIEYNYSSTKVKLYLPSKNESKKVTINYTIKGAVKRFDDCGFLYWNFYDVPKNSTVKEGTLKVSLYNAKFNKDSFFCHLYGDGKKLESYNNEDEISVSFKKLSSLIGIKLKFQEDFLNDDFKSKGYNYDDSVYVFKQSSSGLSIWFDTIIFISICIFGASIALFIYIYEWAFEKKLKKYRSNLKDRTPKLNINSISLAPSNLEPAFVNLLYNDGDCSKNVVLDSLIYLVNKGYYKIVSNDSLDAKKDIIIVYTGKDIEGEKPHLIFLLKWFNKYGDKQGINITKIHERFENMSYARDYIDRKRDFERLVKKDALKLGILFKIKGRAVISNEYFYQKDDWIAYRSTILSNIHAVKNLPSNDVNDVLMYSLSLEIKHNQYESIITAAKNIISNGEDFNRSINGFTADILLIQSLIRCKVSIDKSVAKYKKVADSHSSSGGFSSGRSFSGGGGGSSGGF